MAKRDVVLYYLQLEDQYLEMLDNLKEFKELAANNQISQDDYLAAIDEVEKLKENYERIAYILFLLNQPNRKSKKPDLVSMKWYKALKHASKEAILDENRDALCKIKELLALKKGDNNESN